MTALVPTNEVDWEEVGKALVEKEPDTVELSTTFSPDLPLIVPRLKIQHKTDEEAGIKEGTITFDNEAVPLPMRIKLVSMPRMKRSRWAPFESDDGLLCGSTFETPNIGDRGASDNPVDGDCKACPHQQYLDGNKASCNPEIHCEFLLVDWDYKGIFTFVRSSYSVLMYSTVIQDYVEACQKGIAPSVYVMGLEKRQMGKNTRYYVPTLKREIPYFKEGD